MEISEEINEESDHDDDSPKGYYTRAKRRKLSEEFSDKEDRSSSGLWRSCDVAKRKNPIMFVPTEVLQSIFGYISYRELSTTVRLVNRRFKVVAEDFLNLGFRKINNTLETLIKSINISLGCTQDDMEIKCISKLLNMLEILSLQYTVIMATIWRYVYNEFYGTNKSCMYAGAITDTYHVFIWKFTHYPNQLYAPAVLKDYVNALRFLYLPLQLTIRDFKTLPSEVMNIVQLTKTFCVHFDKTNEEPLPNCLVQSGCKILDLLDNAKFCQKTVFYERTTQHKFTAKYSYNFKNSWFMAMPIPITKEMEWPQKQRLMHMRLRRIVLAHNDMFQQQEQYHREVLLRPDAPIAIKKPANNVYTGYGDVENVFFYYGVMNDGAYRQKFHMDEDNDDNDNDEEDLNHVNDQNAVLEVARRDSEEDLLYRLPYLGFRVDVTVYCPLPYAPMQFLKSLKHAERIELQRKKTTKGETHINVDFHCYAAYYPRLPVGYRFVLRRH